MRKLTKLLVRVSCSEVEEGEEVAEVLLEDMVLGINGCLMFGGTTFAEKTLATEKGREDFPPQDEECGQGTQRGVIDLIASRTGDPFHEVFRAELSQGVGRASRG